MRKFFCILLCVLILFLTFSCYTPSNENYLTDYYFSLYLVGRNCYLTAMIEDISSSQEDRDSYSKYLLEEYQRRLNQSEKECFESYKVCLAIYEENSIQIEYNNLSSSEGMKEMIESRIPQAKIKKIFESYGVNYSNQDNVWEFYSKLHDTYYAKIVLQYISTHPEPEFYGDSYSNYDSYEKYRNQLLDYWKNFKIFEDKIINSYLN